MILSTSSSRAVSMRTGRSRVCRIRLQTSTPSMSGSIRSRTTSAGFSDSTSRSASLPLGVVRTVYPAFFRYAATKEAIDASSSTTRIVCCFPATPACLPVRADEELVGLDARERREICPVHRVLSVAGAEIGNTGDLDPACPDCHDVDAGAVHQQRVVAPDRAEAEVVTPAGLLRVPVRLHAPRTGRHLRRPRVVDGARAPVDDDPSMVDVADHRAGDAEDDDRSGADRRRLSVMHDERAVARGSTGA